MRPFSLIPVLLWAVAVPALAQQAVPAQAVDEPTHEVAHRELRELRDSFVKAVNGGDILDILSYLDRDFVFTGPNGDTVRGHRGVSDYFRTGMVGANRTLVALQVIVEPDSLAILSADEAWAFTYGAGHVRCQMEGNRALNLDGRWTALMAKKEGKWSIASIHYSSNVFSNAILASTRTSSAWTTFAGIVLALFGGLAGGRLLEQWRIRYDAQQGASISAEDGAEGLASADGPQDDQK